MKKYFFVIGCFSCVSLYAQGISGRVVNELSRPLQFANVVLINRTDSAFVSGAVSKADGTFTIETDRTDGLLKVSNIGYVTSYIDARQGNVGDIQMRPDTQILDEVTVKGHRAVYKMTAEGMQANVEGTVLSQLGTADDVLKYVPGIIAKDGAYEVFGKGAPLIYINGRKMRNMKELEQLKSTDIKDVELITNPGAKYDAMVGAVIKIRTIRKEGDGFSIDAWGRWRQGRKAQEAASLDMNYRHNGLDVFASLWASRGKHLQKSEITQDVQIDTLWQQQNNLRTDITSRDYSLEGGFNYELNDNHVFGAKYEITLPTSEDETTALTSNVTANGSFYDRWENMTQKQRNANTDHKLNAYYIGKIGKLDIDWNFDYLHSGCNEQIDIRETCQVEDARKINAENKVKNQMVASKLILAYPLLGGSLDFGAEYINTDRHDDYVTLQNFIQSTYSRLKEQSISPYAEYTRVIPRIGQLRAGLRYERVKFDYYESGQLVEGQSRSYGNIYPSVSFATRLGKVMAQLSYSTKTTRPTYRQLSNDVFYGNRYTLQRGNPLLENSTVHTISLQGTWKFLQFSLSYSDERNAIIHWMEQIENATVTMVTFKNIPSLKSFTPLVSVATTFGIWHPQFSLGMRQQWLTLGTIQGDIHLNKSIVMLQANNTFTFTPSLTGELNFSYQGKGDYQNVSQTYHQTVLNVSLVKTFLDGRVSLKFAGEDLLDRNRDGNLCYNHQVRLYQGNYYDRRRFVVTLRYKFNTTRNKYKGVGAGNDEKKRL